MSCGDCLIELGYYRNYFPQASNRVRLEPRGDRFVEVPVLEGGAR